MAAHAIEVDTIAPASSALSPTRSFQEYSAVRVGEVWRQEDHDFLLRKLAEVDELCIAVWERMARSSSRRSG